MRYKSTLVNMNIFNNFKEKQKSEKKYNTHTLINDIKIEVYNFHFT